MLVKVNTVATPVIIKDLVKALALEWRNLYGELIPKKSAAIIYSQFMTETSNKNIFNNNLGNVKAVDIPNEIVEYMSLSGVWEIINNVRIELLSDNPGAWFRSFSTLDKGVSFYIGFLQTHYGPAWQALENGDPVSFVHMLKTHGYFTAPEADYLKLVQYEFNIFMNGSSYDQAITEIQAADNATVPMPSDWQPLTASKQSAPSLSWRDKIKKWLS